MQSEVSFVAYSFLFGIEFPKCFVTFLLIVPFVACDYISFHGESNNTIFFFPHWHGHVLYCYKIFSYIG